MNLFDDSTPERPQDVTEENWPGLVEQGFEWLTNLGWPLEEFSHSGRRGRSEVDYLKDLYRQHGRHNVKLGYPKNPQTGQPDAEFA